MLRQRVSRLVRRAFSFPKKLDNHIGAIKMFICHYNLTKATAESQHYMDITTPCQVVLALFGMRQRLHSAYGRRCRADRTDGVQWL